jgi:hypothetical protein
MENNMNKLFTISIPDEIYIDNFLENKTAQYTYNGPQILLVAIRGNSSNMILVEQRDQLSGLDVTYVEINAEVDTTVAYFLTTQSATVDYTFEDIVNDYDGSIYVSVSNPRIQDYYKLTYTQGNPGKWSLDLITRNMSTTIEYTVQRELDSVRTTLSLDTLASEEKLVYESYVAECERWLADKAPLHPWKFIDFPAGNVPIIPEVLQNLMEKIKIDGVD